VSALPPGTAALAQSSPVSGSPGLALTAVVVSAVAAFLLVGPRGGGTAVRRLAAHPRHDPADPTGQTRRREGTDGGGRGPWSRWGVPAQGALLVAGVGLVVVLPLRRAVLAGLLTALGVAVVRALERRRVEKEAAARRQAVVEHAEALLGELRAGLPVTTALERAVTAWPEAGPAAAAARWGASVPEALRQLGTLPGAETVTRLAAVWQLCAGSGASLAVGVGHVLETARAEQATRHVVAAELASARATARMLGVMPVMVLVAGQGLGAEPWAFLLDTLPGLACLGAGAGCALAGLWWMDRIAERAIRGAP
jgi:tight adherence protein B